MMLVANYTNVRNDFKNYCDKVVETDQPLIVTRKGDNNIVMVSLDRFTQLEKQARNAEYIAKITRAYEEVTSGGGVQRDLIEID